MDVRWKQRFQNLERAILLLHEALDGDWLGLSDLEKQGAIHRFEIAVELAWKTLKDYLEYSGIVVDQLTPRAVIQQAFSARILSDGPIWIDMLDHRNQLSHKYELALLEEGVRQIVDRYLNAIDELSAFLKERSLT